MSKMFLDATEIMEILGVSRSYAYGLIRKLNGELKKTGYHVIQGKVDRKFFYEQFYVTKNLEGAEA